MNTLFWRHLDFLDDHNTGRFGNPIKESGKMGPQCFSTSPDVQNSR
ncbi:hypothetical protein [Fuerstiella marisgermanici]|nr:hypothetical protein [Fuerstiella marisgermanici]